MSARIDRKTALRRAAAPSVDFSLMPDISAMQALLDAANCEPSRPAAKNSGPTIVPSAQVRETNHESVVPDRFRMRTRPKNAPTLQPFDVPMARALDNDDVSLDAALAFVRTHERAPKPAPRLSEVPTLILEARRPAETMEPQPLHRSPEPPAERPTAFTLTPQGEEEVFWNTESPSEMEDADEPTFAEPVDTELDDWMRTRGRSRFLSALAVVSATLLLVITATAGVLVMASPALVQQAQTVQQAPPAPLPPPARP